MKCTYCLLRITALLAVVCLAAGCKDACRSSSGTSSSGGKDAAVVDPVAALLAEDETDAAIVHGLKSRNIAGWLVELRASPGQLGGGYRIAVTGGGRVSRWDASDAQGLAHDTLLVPKHKILRLFAKFEKAHFETLPSDAPSGSVGHDTQTYTLALTRDDKTVVITRSGPAEPEYAALVKLTRDTGDIGSLPHTSDDCQWTLACKVAGHCSAQGNRCVAAMNCDCASTEACKLDGKCTARDGECVVASDQDCAASARCLSDGRCVASGGGCAASAEGCKASRRCREDGACGLLDGLCAARAEAHCRSSQQCARSGLCVARDGVCVASRDADCRASAACAETRRCMAKCDRCVEAADTDCSILSLEEAARADLPDASAD